MTKSYTMVVEYSEMHHGRCFIDVPADSKDEAHVQYKKGNYEIYDLEPLEVTDLHLYGFLDIWEDKDPS